MVLIALQIIDVRAQAQGEAYDLIRRMFFFEPTQHHVAFKVCPKGDYFELYHKGCAFARLDKAFCSEARRLVGLSVSFQACLERNRWEQDTIARRPFADGTATFSVDVNVKSLMHHAETVGNILLRSGSLLQFPTHNPGGESYFNPQILQIEGFFQKDDNLISEAEDSPTPAVILDRSAQSNLKPSPNPQDQVEQILDSLTHTSILHEIFTDTSRIKSTLMR